MWPWIYVGFGTVLRELNMIEWSTTYLDDLEIGSFQLILDDGPARSFLGISMVIIYLWIYCIWYLIHCSISLLSFRKKDQVPLTSSDTPHLLQRQRRFCANALHPAVREEIGRWRPLERKPRKCHYETALNSFMKRIAGDFQWDIRMLELTM